MEDSSSFPCSKSDFLGQRLSVSRSKGIGESTWPAGILSMAWIRRWRSRSGRSRVTRIVVDVGATVPFVAVLPVAVSGPKVGRPVAAPCEFWGPVKWARETLFANVIPENMPPFTAAKTSWRRSSGLVIGVRIREGSRRQGEGINRLGHSLSSMEDLVPHQGTTLSSKCRVWWEGGTNLLTNY